MDAELFFWFVVPFGILSVWAFAAMMRTVAARKKQDPRSAFRTSVLLYGLFGLIIPFLLLYIGVEIFYYWLIIVSAAAPIYVIVNAILKRQERQTIPPPASKDQRPQPVPPPSEKKERVMKRLPETKKEVDSSHIFISYRRSDSADITGRIYDRLTGRFGRAPIFKDVDSIPLGLDFKEYLDKKVGECDVLLAVIGDRWLDSIDQTGEHRLEDPTDFVRIEIEAALERDIPVIPLLVRGAEMPRAERLPPGLKKLVYRNGIPVRSDPDFHRDMDRLISALEKYVR